jgi:hypothetical protein
MNKLIYSKNKRDKNAVSNFSLVKHSAQTAVHKMSLTRRDRKTIVQQFLNKFIHSKILRERESNCFALSVSFN